MESLHIKFAFFLLKEKKNFVSFEDFLEKYKTENIKNTFKELTDINYGEDFKVFFLEEKEERNLFKILLSDKSYILSMPIKIGSCKSLTKEKEINSDIEEVFYFWKEIMGENRKKLTDNRKRVIKEALLKYNKTECKNAIIGCSKSLFHMGYNPITGEENKKLYNDILNIFVFKRGSNFEKLIEKQNWDTLDNQLKNIKKNSKKDKRDIVKKQRNLLDEL